VTLYLYNEALDQYNGSLHRVNVTLYLYNEALHRYNESLNLYNGSLHRVNVMLYWSNEALQRFRASALPALPTHLEPGQGAFQGEPAWQAFVSAGYRWSIIRRDSSTCRSFSASTTVARCRSARWLVSTVTIWSVSTQ
jgi:hypothetical protein